MVSAYGIGKCARINHIDGWSPSGQELIPANEAINWNKNRYEPCETGFVCAVAHTGAVWWVPVRGVPRPGAIRVRKYAEITSSNVSLT
jgi:hypothetical protein